MVAESFSFLKNLQETSYNNVDELNVSNSKELKKQELLEV